MKISRIITIGMISFLSFISNQSNAQVSVGANVGLIKIIDDGGFAPTLLGATLSGKYRFANRVRVGASLGYYTGSQEITPGFSADMSVMPISGLAEYIFTDAEFAPYAGLNVGMNNVTISVRSSSQSEMAFGLAPVVGLDYTINDNISINVNAKYHYMLISGSGSGSTSSSAISGIGFGVGANYMF